MTSREQLLADLMQTINILRKGMFTRDAKARVRITPQQWLVLRIISLNVESTVKDVAAKMQMSSSAATQLVDKLVKNGYVKRTNNTGDRRTINLAIASKARTEIQKLRGQALERTTDIFKALNDKEIAQLAALHQKIAQSINSKKK